MIRTAETTDKLRGGYYTPPAVANWLAHWAIRLGDDRVLEPSCGDGVFLAAALEELALADEGACQSEVQIVGIELVPSEAGKARTRLGESPIADRVEVVTGDFFRWQESCASGMFDVVLGNPPFIRYQSFPEPSRTLAMQLLRSEGLSPNKLTNIWVPFVVASTRLLRPRGRLAMVLPAELLQVTYAAQLRRYLADNFGRLTIVACNEMFFAGAEQEVVLVLAEGKLEIPDCRNRCDIALVEEGSISELLQKPPITKRVLGDYKYVQHETEKWLKYFLSRREIDLLRSLRRHEAVGVLGIHASIDVGIVTGKNEFFVLSQEQVDQYDLRDFVIPLVGRSVQLSGAILRKNELRDLAKQGKRVHLLSLMNCTDKEFTAGLRRFIALGEESGFHTGYKCRIRNAWYHVPSVWEPDCFFFRQIYDFPRVVVNRAGATSTDTIHRMQCKKAPARVAASLYTHLTAASAEIEGRSYGGGVLELEPTEAEHLLVPKRLNGAMPIGEADRLVRQGRLADVLDYNDRIVLQDSLGLTSSDCSMLKQVWAKMRERRFSRRRRQR